MYAYFIGKVTYITADHIILETGSIGYNIYMPSTYISDLIIGQEVKVYTYTSVREDAFILYGFLDMEELEFFKLLLSVNGVGPKAAINILGASSIDSLQLAIISQDIKALSKVQGIGAKTAARIILDLKDKVTGEDLLRGVRDNSHSVDTAKASGIKGEAMQALNALGYSNSEAMSAINKVDITEDMTVEDLIKKALFNI